MAGNWSQMIFAFAVRDSPRNWLTNLRSGKSLPPFWAARTWEKMSLARAASSYHQGEVRSVGRNLRQERGKSTLGGYRFSVSFRRGGAGLAGLPQRPDH